VRGEDEVDAAPPERLLWSRRISRTADADLPAERLEHVQVGA
jgi:hypothetical protein